MQKQQRDSWCALGLMCWDCLSSLCSCCCCKAWLGAGGVYYSGLRQHKTQNTQNVMPGKKWEEAQAEGEEDEAAAKKRNQINKHSCRRMLHATRQQLSRQPAQGSSYNTAWDTHKQTSTLTHTPTHRTFPLCWKSFAAGLLQMFYRW